MEKMIKIPEKEYLRLLKYEELIKNNSKSYSVNEPFGEVISEIADPEIINNIIKHIRAYNSQSTTNSIISNLQTPENIKQFLLDQSHFTINHTDLFEKFEDYYDLLELDYDQKDFCVMFNAFEKMKKTYAKNLDITFVMDKIISVINDIGRQIESGQEYSKSNIEMSIKFYLLISKINKNDNREIIVKKIIEEIEDDYLKDLSINSLFLAFYEDDTTEKLMDIFIKNKYYEAIFNYIERNIAYHAYIRFNKRFEIANTFYSKVDIKDLEEYGISEERIKSVKNARVKGLFA